MKEKSNDFSNVMSKQTDDDLIAILTVKRLDYAEEAVMAAQLEFDKRQIPSDKIDQIKKDQLAIKEKKDVLANEPLERDVKILAMVFPLIARFIYTDKFRKGGYDRKVEEMSSAFFVGRLYLFGLIALIIILVKFLF